MAVVDLPKIRVRCVLLPSVVCSISCRSGGDMSRWRRLMRKCYCQALRILIVSIVIIVENAVNVLLKV